MPTRIAADPRLPPRLALQPCSSPALYHKQGANLYERMVTALVRIAQGSLSHEAGAAAVAPLEEQAIRYEVCRQRARVLLLLVVWPAAACWQSPS